MSIKIGIFLVSLYGIRDVTSDYVRIFTYNISQFVVRILNVIEDKNLLLFYSLLVEEDVTIMNDRDETLYAHYFYTLLALYEMISNVY